MPLTTGDRLGPYEVLSLLGAGGMGEVYKARDTRLDRTVAVKVLSVHLDGYGARERFAREARLVSSLNHPHICALYDIGSQDGIDFLVMEYVEGETLATRLSSGPLALERILQYAIQIADALALAHGKGIVHRDLKPGNIMLAKDGAKLLDFGLAKLQSGPGSVLPDDATLAASLTRQGAILGTIQYMAPEQLEGKDADSRSDIFAFGAVLYEMHTGRKAFAGNSHASVIAAIMSSNPAAISGASTNEPPAFERAILTCLAKDPHQRWQNAHDLLLHLQSITLLTPITARSWYSLRDRILQALTLIGVAAAAAAVTIQFRQGPGEKPLMRLAVPIAADFSFEALDFPVLSPDGHRLSFCATTKDHKRMLWVHTLDSSTTQPFAKTESCNAPFWSADGRAIAFFTGAELKKLDVTTGDVQTICEATGNGTGGSWNADNVVVFSTLGQPIQRVSASGGTSVRLLNLDAARQETAQRSPRFLSDGRRFVYSSTARNVAESGVIVASLDGTHRILISGDIRLVGVVSGFFLYLRGRTLLAQAFDADTLQLKGDPLTVSEPVGSERGIVLASFSDDGKLAYRPASATASELASYDREGKRSSIQGQARNYVGVKLSPDNQRLVVNVLDGGTSNLWLLELGNGILTRLTFAQAEDSVWSPNGKELVFASRGKGGTQSELYRKTIGAASEKIFFASPEDKYPEEWLSGGNILFITRQGKKFASVPVSGDRKPTILLEDQFQKDGPRVSPDGNWIAYASQESGVWQIHVASYPAFEQRRQISHQGGIQARWNHNGRELFYLDLDAKVMAVPVTANRVSIATGAPKAVFSTRIRLAPTEDQYTVMNDGRRFIVVEPVSEVSPRIHLTLNWFAAMSK
jgi:eukaryotic-like serine/threonine-protein kinase